VFLFGRNGLPPFFADDSGLRKQQKIALKINQVLFLLQQLHICIL
jgi:hypothetical protein